MRAWTFPVRRGGRTRSAASQPARSTPPVFQERHPVGRPILGSRCIHPVVHSWSSCWRRGCLDLRLLLGMDRSTEGLELNRCPLGSACAGWENCGDPLWEPGQSCPIGRQSLLDRRRRISINWRLNLGFRSLTLFPGIFRLSQMPRYNQFGSSGYRVHPCEFSAEWIVRCYARSEKN